jgi:hypothetical protein
MFPSEREMRGPLLLAVGLFLALFAGLLTLAFFIGRWTA